MIPSICCLVAYNADAYEVVNQSVASSSAVVAVVAAAAAVAAVVVVFYSLDGKCEIEVYIGFDRNVADLTTRCDALEEFVAVIPIEVAIDNVVVEQEQIVQHVDYCTS